MESKMPILEIDPMFRKYLKSVEPLSAENQKLLLDFLLTILADTTCLKVKCLSSHHDKYIYRDC